MDIRVELNYLVERRRQEMVDLWTDQNAEKRYERSLEHERKETDRRNIELEREKLEIERELENRKRIEKQNMLKEELQRQIHELSMLKSSRHFEAVTISLPFQQ